MRVVAGELGFHPLRHPDDIDLHASARRAGDEFHAAPRAEAQAGQQFPGRRHLRHGVAGVDVKEDRVHQPGPAIGVQGLGHPGPIPRRQAVHLESLTEHCLGLGAISLLHTDLSQQQITVCEAWPPGESSTRAR